MRQAIRQTAKSSDGEWYAPAWDRLTAGWAGGVGVAGVGDRGGGEVRATTRAAVSPAMADFPAAIDLATLNGTNGFRIDGVDAFDYSGWSVSSAGDVNGDGFGDIIIGAYGADPSGDSKAGESYVVFGKAGGFAPSFELASLDGSNGFRIDGINADDRSGFSVSSAGDVNGDGVDDIIIGAFGGDPGGDSYAGESYVVFGKAGGFATSLDLAALNGSNGFRIDGIDAADSSGRAVCAAGDVNGDGFDDIIIGAYRANPGGDSFAGESYVVFGKTGGFAASLDLATLSGNNGFRLVGIDANDLSGISVSSAGDVNGDGFDDIIIGAFGGDPPGGDAAGESYVVFGEAGGFTASVDLSTLNGSNGFRLDGLDTQDQSGFSVSSAGDVNGDGFDDIVIGARYADPGGQTRAGESYVVFGKAGGFAATFGLATLNGANGFRIAGLYAEDRTGISVSSAGDINGDGFDDVIVGAYRAGSGGDDDAGGSYVVFGKAGGFAASIELATLDGTNGFRIDGIDADDRSGRSVSSAGDVNGDGFDDVIIGASSAETGSNSNAGESYVVFGRAPTTAVERIGSDAAQEIRGGDFDDTLKGLLGNDALYGAGGADFLEGGPGDDLIRGGKGNDFIRGGGGPGGFFTNDDRLFGESGNDTIEAGGADIIDGGRGTDTLIAEGASIFTGYVWDMTTGVTNVAGQMAVNFENATINNFDRADSITGTSAANIIRTTGGADTISGRGGADTLAGGAGQDRLTGGTGADRFEFASRNAADADTITDFAPNADRIALDGAVFGLPAGALSPGRFVVGTAAGDGNDRLIYNDANGKLFFDADGTSAQAKVLIATLSGAPTIDAGDFIVIGTAFQNAPQEGELFDQPMFAAPAMTELQGLAAQFA